MRRWARRTLAVLAGLLALSVVVLAGLMGYASLLLEKRWDVPTPPIRAARDPAEVARGERIFRSTCLLCHGGADGRASGRRMDDIPAFLGTFHSANITADAAAGVGRWTDDDLARAIRFSVRPDRRALFVMPSYRAMSDADVAAVMGFMRSGDPIFRGVPRAQPRSVPSLVGKLLLATVVGFDPSGRATGVVAPPPGPTAEYGRYLTEKILQCGDCHTKGYAPSKSLGPRAYAGGAELVLPDGTTSETPNLTPDPDTGLGAWTREDFVRAVRDGVRPDGRALRPPMPLYRALTDDELGAVWAFFRTLPPVRNAPRRAPYHEAGGSEAPAALFERHGCAQCHGEGAPYRAKLRNAVHHDAAEVAARILHPETFSKGSAMPTYAGRIDEPTAKALAEWVKLQAERIPEGE